MTPSSGGGNLKGKMRGLEMKMVSYYQSVSKKSTTGGKWSADGKNNVTYCRYSIFSSFYLFIFVDLFYLSESNYRAQYCTI